MGFQQRPRDQMLAVNTKLFTHTGDPDSALPLLWWIPSEILTQIILSGEGGRTE